ncbi:MAG: type IV pilus assembly protein PilM [Candidatus Omnitrophota bacterium]
MANILSKIKNNFSRERFCIGLDIGTQSVKIARLKLAKDEVTLCGFDIEPAKLELSGAFKKIKEPRFADTLNISVSGPQTVIRYANFPKMNSQELRRSLKFEAHKYIPFSVSEVNLDACILKNDPVDSKMLVLIAAAKKEMVASRLELIESINLPVNLVEVDSISLVNAFIFNNPPEDSAGDKAVALLNIGASVSNLNILEGAIPRLSRDMHIAGNTFSQKIMDIFGVAFNDAERLKTEPEREAENEDRINAALESVLSNMATDIRTSFDYYESQGSSSVVKIFLSGGGARFKGLKEALARLLGIEVEFWDPLKRLVIDAAVGVDKAKEASGQLAVAVGLALRG